MFEIGNKIRLKGEYKNTTLSERNYIPQSVVDNIADEIHTVTNVGADSVSYYIEIDDNGYSWNPDMFELVIDQNLVLA